MTNDVIVPEEVRGLFEKRRGRGSYKRWFRRFERNCNNFATIGREVGLSRERVRQLYDKYFAPYLPAKTGHARRKVCTAHQKKIRYERVRHVVPVDSPVFKKIAGEARERGWKIEAVPRIKNTGKIGPSKTELMINGHRIRIGHRRSLSTPSSVVCCVSLSAVQYYDFQLFYLDVKGYSDVWYIIPKEIISDAPLCIDREGRKVFALPMLEARSKPSFGWRITKQPIVDWRAYRNAWHLLDSGKEDVRGERN